MIVQIRTLEGTPDHPVGGSDIVSDEISAVGKIVI